MSEASALDAPTTSEDAKVGVRVMGPFEPMCFGGITIRGESAAGVSTSINIMTYKLLIDVGPQCPASWVKAAQYCLVSHCHLDHFGGLPAHAATRNLVSAPKSQFFVPENFVEKLTGLMNAYSAIEQCDVPCQITAAVPGVEIKLPSNIFVRPFPTVHRVDSIGYALYQRNRKLKAEYKDLEHTAVAALRQSGVDIHDESERLEVAFTSDTQIEVLDLNPHLRQAKVLILECTFVDDKISVTTARERGHIHLDEIVERAEYFEHVQHLILTHFSVRYNLETIVEWVNKKLPEELRRKTTILPPYDR